jgi:hypothetical protein
MEQIEDSGYPRIHGKDIIRIVMEDRRSVDGTPDADIPHGNCRYLKMKQITAGGGLR